MQQDSPTRAWAYRPQLDGLRAIAVYLVVLYHAGVSRLGGGFIGVDVFFVLSGYLVTNILLVDIDGADGRVRFGRFYSRRVRRLLPAAAVNLLVTAVVFSAIASPVEIEEARSAIAAAALYVANWHFIGVSTDYFAAEVAPSPVLHYWSLAIEEQFYVLWPLLLVGLFRVTRRAGARRRDVVRIVILVAGVASAAWALSLAASEPTRAYMGTDTRAYQLLAGAALALTPGIVARLRRSRAASAMPFVAAGTVAAVVVLATSAVELDAVRRGIATTVAACGLLVALEASDRGPVHRLLTSAPVVYLGRISYGTYLWHWLVIVVLASEAEVSPLATAAIAVVVGTGLASLSYQIIEQPVRSAERLHRRPGPVVVVGVATSLLVGLVAAPAILAAAEPDARPIASGPSAVVGGEASMTPGEAYFDRFDYEGCPPGEHPCTVVEGSGLTAIVIGDSHAAVLVPVLADIAARHDVELASGLLMYCPWPWGIGYLRVGADCYGDQDDLYERRLPEVDPDIVFLAHRPIDDPHNASAVRDRDVGRLDEDDAARDAAVDRRISDLVAHLRSEGRIVVMFEPIPPSPLPLDPRECLSTADVIEECRFVTGPPTPEERVMRRLAEADDGVVSVDMDALACPFLPICDPIVNGIIVRIDDNHLTDSFVRTLADPLDAYLTGQRVFPARDVRPVG